MVFCLFCPAELNENTKPEHILLNALGGRKTTSRAICSACNNKFGGIIDAELSNQIKSLRNFLQLESGSGNLAPSLTGVQAGVGKVNIKGNGDIELATKPFTIEDLGDGRANIQIRARSEEHLAEIVPHIAAALKMPEALLRDQIATGQAAVIEQRPGVVALNNSLGGPLALRSISKSMLVLWSTLVGNKEVRGAAYDAVRHFINNGGEEFVREMTSLDSRFFVSSDEMKLDFGPLFNLIYVRSDATGRVVGHFTLYNLVAWKVTIAEGGGAPNAKVALISNPLDPSQWSGNAEKNFDVPFEWLNSPDYDIRHSKARFEAALKYYFEVHGRKALEKIIDTTFAKFELRSDMPIPPENLTEFINKTAGRLAHYGLGLPYEEKLTPERLAEILKKK